MRYSLNTLGDKMMLQNVTIKCLPWFLIAFDYSVGRDSWREQVLSINTKYKTIFLLVKLTNVLSLYIHIICCLYTTQCNWPVPINFVMITISKIDICNDNESLDIYNLLSALSFFQGHILKVKWSFLSNNNFLPLFQLRPS